MKISFELQGFCIVEDADKTPSATEIQKQIENELEYCFGIKSEIIVSNYRVDE